MKRSVVRVAQSAFMLLLAAWPAILCAKGNGVGVGFEGCVISAQVRGSDVDVILSGALTLTRYHSGDVERMTVAETDVLTATLSQCEFFVRMSPDGRAGSVGGELQLILVKSAIDQRAVRMQFGVPQIRFSKSGYVDYLSAEVVRITEHDMP